MTVETTAIQRFSAEIDQQRWWSTAEIVVPLVQSGLWAELGLPDPYKQAVEVVLGEYAVVQNGHDITRRVDVLLGGLKMCAVDPGAPAEMPLLGSLGLVDSNYGATALYKAFGQLFGSELEAIADQLGRAAVYSQERVDEMVRVADLMRTLGTDRISDVIADPFPVNVSIVLSRPGR